MSQDTKIEFTTPVTVHRDDQMPDEECWSSFFSLPEVDGQARVFCTWVVRRPMADINLHETIDPDQIPAEMANADGFWSIMLQAYDGLVVPPLQHPIINWDPYAKQLDASWEWTVWPASSTMGFAGCAAFITTATIAHRVITQSEQYRNLPLFIQATDRKRHQLFERWVRPRLQFDVSAIKHVEYEDDYGEDIYYTLLQF